VEGHPEAPEYQSSLAANYYNLGNLYQAAGRSKEAEAAYHEALAILRSLAEKHRELPKHQP